MIQRVRAKRVRLERGIIILPSAFTLGNLFLGIYAMVSAARGEFETASWSIVFAALLDMLDGRIARFTATGSRFGAELDSLVDAISFGVAPGFLAYALFFDGQTWSWILSFLYVTAVVVRLARYNVEQAGHAKRYFHGLPSPTAGMVLATVYPFLTSAALSPVVGGAPSPQTVGILMVVLAALMLSHIPYPIVPRLSFRTPLATARSLLLALLAAAALAVPEYAIFPVLCAYTVWGVARSTVLGLVDRLPDQDPLLDGEGAGADEGDAEIRSVDYREIAPIRYPSSGARPAEGTARGSRPDTGGQREDTG